MKIIKLTQSEINALRDIADMIGSNINDLAALIQFESGWNPLAINPNSSAKGLIQFIDSTARDLGFTSSAELIALHPTKLSQLRGPVAEYFARRYTQYGPLNTRHKLAMSVFYPAYINEPPAKQFPKNVIAANPGIERPIDYTNLAFSQPVNIETKQANSAFLIIAAAAAAAIFYLRKG